jgi:hypothetical protein
MERKEYKYDNADIFGSIIPLTLKEFRGKFLLNVYDTIHHSPLILQTFDSFDEAKSYLYRYYPYMKERN